MILERERQNEVATLELINELITSLHREDVVYCHWKSNFHLSEALTTGSDLDLLVAHKDVQRFEEILESLGFKKVIDQVQGPIPSVFHYYGMDHATNEWVHLHVYYRVLTGESLLKNYDFPLEELLLQNRSELQGVPVPQRPAELMLFVIRMMLKHASLIEYILLRRDRSGYAALRDELDTLLIDDSAASCCELLAEWLPSVDRVLFMECVEALRTNASSLHRMRLALKLRKQIQMYHRFSSMQANVLRAKIFFKRVLGRIQRRKSKQLASGGRLIAFVGPEATGKSTLVYESVRWLGKVFEVESAHLGKPPSTWLTFLPNIVMPLLRRAAPQQRTSRMLSQAPDPIIHSPSLMYAFRAVLIAWDRRAHAVKLHRKTVNGSIVICDRYPSATVGAMDSARLQVEASSSKLINYLAKMENHLYRQIPAPDVVIRLTVAIDVAVERNRERQKRGKETDTYVRNRHMNSLHPSFPSSKMIELDSNQSRAHTVNRVRQIMWDLL